MFTVDPEWRVTYLNPAGERITGTRKAQAVGRFCFEAVERFIERFNDLKGRQIEGMSPAALAILMGHNYPGNVRELMNIVEHAFVLCTGRELLPQHLPLALAKVVVPAAAKPLQSSRQALAEAERRVIRETLTRFQNNRKATAEALGVHKTTLWRRMRELGIEVSRLPPS